MTSRPLIVCDSCGYGSPYALGWLSMRVGYMRYKHACGRRCAEKINGGEWREITKRSLKKVQG